MKVEYYMCMVKDEELYEKLNKKYEFYTIEEKITQCNHEIDIEINEVMNTRISKYTPKIKHHSKSISLEARVKTAARIYNCGYHFFWNEVMNGLEVDISISLELHLLELDKTKSRKSIREHGHANMAKRKRNKYANITKESKKILKDIDKNMNYWSQINYNESGRKHGEKKEGGEAKKRGNNEVKWYNHGFYCFVRGGIEKTTHYLDEVSKYCMFNGKSKEKIGVSVRWKYLSSIATSETGGIGKLMMSRSQTYATF